MDKPPRLEVFRERHPFASRYYALRAAYRRAGLPLPHVWYTIESFEYWCGLHRLERDDRLLGIEGALPSPSRYIIEQTKGNAMRQGRYKFYRAAGEHIPDPRRVIRQ